MAIAGQGFSKAMGASEMRRRHANKLYNVSVDITSLPGMFSIHAGALDNFDGPNELLKWWLCYYLLGLESAPKSTTPYGRPGDDMLWSRFGMLIVSSNL
jgi:hypothetical protein